MNKAQTLREHLLASPLKLRGTDVLLSVTDCKVLSSVGHDNRHFEMSYTADLILLNFSGAADVLAFVLLSWLETAQPYRQDEAFTLEADVLDHKKADIHIKIPLTETVKVEFAPDGVRLWHTDEPGIEQRLSAADWKLFVNDELWAEWQQPN